MWTKRAAHGNFSLQILRGPGHWAGTACGPNLAVIWFRGNYLLRYGVVVKGAGLCALGASLH